jgi:hypothetical protein
VPATTRTKQRHGLFINTVSINCNAMHFLNSTAPVVGNRERHIICQQPFPAL